MKGNFLIVLLILSLLCCFLVYLPSCAVLNESSNLVQEPFVNPGADEFDFQRRQMVEQQLQGRGIKDKAVLEAMLSVPRHRFVDSSLAQVAYADYPLPIGDDQTISQPLIEQRAMNGRMVIPVGERYQEMVVLTKTQEGLIEQRTLPVRFVPLRRDSP